MRKGVGEVYSYSYSYSYSSSYYYYYYHYYYTTTTTGATSSAASSIIRSSSTPASLPSELDASAFSSSSRFAFSESLSRCRQRRCPEMSPLPVRATVPSTCWHGREDEVS